MLADKLGEEALDYYNSALSLEPMSVKPIEINFTLIFYRSCRCKKIFLDVIEIVPDFEETFQHWKYLPGQFAQNEDIRAYVTLHFIIFSQII